MTDILVRRVREQDYEALKAKAQASKEGNLEAWLRQQLAILAQGPVVKERYTIRIGGVGQIRRFSNACTSTTYRDADEATVKLLERAEVMVQRNEPNDRESALDLLRDHFYDVYEV